MAVDEYWAFKANNLGRSPASLTMVHGVGDEAAKLGALQGGRILAGNALKHSTK